MALPVEQVAAAKSHLYLWVPNALLPDGLAVMKAWGFEYKGNIIWEKVRKDGGPDGRGVGFYFRNVTEILLFGVKGDNFRTLAPARSQVLRVVLQALFLNYLPVVIVKAGICGATKLPQITNPPGVLIATIL